jgi:4-amino-4-deoxy-L-arabinose transferase-like glycosyltransferase
VSCWCLALFFYGLNAGALVRTEGLRSEVAREMLRSGNWIVPTLLGEPLFTKPPGMYVAIVLCSWPLGDVTLWSARLPSAIAATITVWMFFLFFRRYLGRRAGLLAALLLPTSALWLEKVPAAEIDMVHVAFVSAAILCFLRAVEEEEGARPAGRWWYGAALAMAAGFLTKWTAPVFVYSTALAFLWWRGRLRILLNRHHLLALGLATILCLAWAAWAVSLTSWQVFSETVQREGLPRLVPNYDRPYRYGEALLHPLKLMLTTLPWSLLALGTLWPGFYRGIDERSRFLAAAFHAWTWPNILIWSYVGEHTPRHSFPLFPGIAGLAVLFFLKGLARHPRVQRTLLIGALALWIIMKIVFVEIVVPARAAECHQREALLSTPGKGE